MRAIPQHPGREWRQCELHKGRFFPRAVGCPVCRAQRRAEELAAQPRRPLADLIAEEQALTERAVQRATATIGLIDAALSDDEQRRKAQHEAAALETVAAALFWELCGPESKRLENSAFELECVNGGRT